MTATIQDVRARMILDSRGVPTVEAEVELRGGVVACASAPAGASKGTHEHVELRDGNSSLWDGRGVDRAVKSIIDVIAPALQGRDPTDQKWIDRTLVELDGTSDRSYLGTNALLPVSVACAKAVAANDGVELWEHLVADRGPVLPLPMVNILSGNLHAGGGMDVQDVLVVPHGAPDYLTGLRWVSDTYRATAALLKERGFPTLLGDEGGFGFVQGNSEDGIALVSQAIEKSGLVPGRDASIALDIAATHLFHDGSYMLDGERLLPEALSERVEQWALRYPIVSVEDPFHEEAWPSWSGFVARNEGRGLQVVADDLVVSNPLRLDRAVREQAANCLLLKANQVGTLSEALDLSSAADGAGHCVIVSARSGETEDTWLAHLAVASGAGQIKIGSVARSERLAKYNELLRIHQRSPWLPYPGNRQGSQARVVL